jgi:hypothetical protein
MTELVVSILLQEPQWCIDFTLKAKTFLKHGINILEVGSLDVNGSVRFVFSDIWNYTEKNC